MVNKLAAALIAICVPGTAAAWEWGTASGGSLDVYYVPSFKDDVGTVLRGDGIGTRGTFKVHQMVATLFEYNQLSYDGGSDYDQMHLGLGVTLPSGTGLFVEYGKDDVDGVSSDGFGARARVMAQALPDVQVQLDLGQIQYDGDLGKYDELFYAVGGTFAISRDWGFFANYKVSTYDASGTSSDEEIAIAQVGVNIRLHY